MPALPDRAAFEEVCQELAQGAALTFRQLGRIFGPDFWDLLIVSLGSVRISTDRLDVHLDT